MAIGRPLSIASGQVASKNISFTATSGQTVFNIPGGYNVNQIHVYRNGARLNTPADFSAIDSSSIKLLSAASLGDIIDVQVFSSFSVSDAITSSNDSQTISGELNVGNGLNVTGDLSVTAGYNLGIHSGGLNITTGVVTAINFTGNSNELTYNSVTKTVDVSIGGVGSPIEVGTGATISSPSTNTLTFGTNNAERLRINSSGFVGVNTDSPLTPLDVEGVGENVVSRFSNGTRGLEIAATSTGGALQTYNANQSIDIKTYSTSNSHIVLSTNNTERLRILSDGSVTLGGVSATPGTVAAGSFIQGSANAGIFVDGYDGKFGTSSNHPVYIQPNGSTKLGVLADGQIYHYLYDRWFANDSTTTIGYIGPDDQMVGGGSNADFSIASNAGKLTFVTGATRRACFTTAGDFGVNTTSPGGRIESSFNSASTVGLVLRNANQGTCARIIYGSTIVGSITNTNTATAFNTSSDYRLKENVVDISGSIDRVKQLKPKRFNFIADKEKIVDGFLAHEAQAVVPESVTGEKDGEEMQGIDQSKLVPLLTGALKEAIARIETLEAEVAALKGS